MALKVLFLRGTTVENNLYTGQVGEITIDLTAKAMRIHDGITAGGHAVLGATAVQSQIDALALRVTDNEVDIASIQGLITTIQTELAGKVDTAHLFDVNNKIKLEHISDSILGQVEYMGVWNATLNTPALPLIPTLASKGEYYVTSVGGTFNGVIYEVGDWIISNGATWDKVNNTDAVSSVNGKTGVVVLTKADVGLGNVDNTSDLAKPVSTATQAALNLKADLAYVNSLETGVASVTGSGAVIVNNFDPANPVVGITVATTLAAGSMSATDKTKLDGIAAGAQVNTVNSVNGKTGAVVLTKADVGLGNVDNYATASAIESAAGTAADKFSTALGVRQFIEGMGFVQSGTGEWTLDQGNI